ncbi:MAG: hypothetical protein ACK5OX_05505, partial [Desertimonas sp.]
MSGRDLHVSVVANPAAAGAAARRRLRSGEDLDDSARAALQWIIGRADRDAGFLESSRRALHSVLGHARTTGDERTFVGASCSLAYTLMRLGDLDGAGRVLDVAAISATPIEQARIGAQRAELIGYRGRLALGAAMLRTACDEMRRLDDVIHEARHRAHLAEMYCELDRYAAARAQLDRSVELAERLDLDLLVAHGFGTLGRILMLQGDLPGALRALGNSEQRHRRAQTFAYLPTVLAAHAQALALAGLFDDADVGFQHAVRLFRGQGQQTDLPGCLCQMAHVRLAKNDPQGARVAAEEAAELWVAQGRRSLVTVSRSIALEAQGLIDGPSTEVIGGLDQVAGELDGLGLLSAARRARLVVARLRVECGDVADEVVDQRLRTSVRRGRTGEQIALAYIDALRAVEEGRRGAARRALDRGVRAAVGAQACFGGFEARAQAAESAYQLTDLGARLAVEDRRPRELLARIEVTRAMMTRLPPIQPDDDEVSAPLLAELRRIGLRIRDPETPPAERRRDEQRRLQIERRLATRNRFRTAVRDDERPAVNVAIQQAIELLGDDRQLLAHANIDGRLWAVSVTRGRARLHE